MLKRILKVLGGLIVVVVAGGGAFVGYCSLAWPRRLAPAPPAVAALKVDSTPARVARGKEIVSSLCANCHFDQATQALTGRRMVDTPKQFGLFCSHNITQDPDHGIGKYTDGELVYLLRTGIERDGTFAGPFMTHRRMSDEDVDSIISFLRSDDPWVRPNPKPNLPSNASVLARVLMHTVMGPADYPDGPLDAPSPSDAVAYGGYLANDVFDCYACHSADFKSNDSHQPEHSRGFYGGGNPLVDSDGNVVASANLTFDKETGIGLWSEPEFRRALKEGFRPDGRALRYPMEPAPELTDDEVAAIYAYLQTVPVISHPMDRFAEPAPAANASLGEQLYRKYSCQSCHGASGVGACDVREAFQQFTGDDQIISFLHDPSRYFPGSKMPTWSGVIQEDEYAPLLRYVHQLADAAGPLPGPVPPLPVADP